MAVFKCKMCGGNLELQENMTVCECEYCGSTQTVPALDNEKKITHFAFKNCHHFSSQISFYLKATINRLILTYFPYYCKNQDY